MWVEERHLDNCSGLLPPVEHEKFLGHSMFHCALIEFPRETGKTVKVPLLIECQSQGAR